MSATLRRLVALLASIALVAGVPAVVAGSASAAGVQAPARAVFGYGLNYGYEVGWLPPADIEGLTGYTVSLYLASDVTRTVPVQPARTVPASTPSEYLYSRFTGLTPGTSYVGVVVASYGVDGDAEGVAANADQAYEPIGRVGSLKVVAGNRTATASWKAPTPTGLTGPVEGYRVEISGNGFFTMLAASQRTIRFGNLVNGRRYAVVVTALAGDLGTASAASATPIGTPARPTKLKRTWKKGGKAKLTWKGARSTAAAPVAGYVVYVNGKKVATLSRFARSYTAKHEKKGKRYSFSVRSRNPIGYSTSATVKSKKRPIK
jgi:hypothetical protein